MPTQKLYKYRSLSPFLYKELDYQELYFASCSELNDPLDLRTQVEFSLVNKKHISALTHFLFRESIVLPASGSEAILTNTRKVVAFCQNKPKIDAFEKELAERLSKACKNGAFIYETQAHDLTMDMVKEQRFDFHLDVNACFERISQLIKKFLLNSYTSCFSADPLNFLMWSHYAGSHRGICLEFTLTKNGKFSFEEMGRRKFLDDKYGQDLAKGQIETISYGDNIWPVNYQDEERCINFFDFAPVFLNPDDIDLQQLSKSRWHGFADHLQRIFATKKTAWEYEKEWRIIEVNFAGEKQPEERIRHYPIEALTGIYFGTSTPETDKKRIYKLMENKGHQLNYWECKLSNGQKLISQPWEAPEWK
ncbi:hypothetical protein ASE74_16000 [Pedobacter sp. Leaf216]|uniref:DUF2971 domain-containing protein n=1 Tax=Pedobacter sp. Leaf216 TaxID=1735684 RepID=UPI0006F1DFEE|nr:DUF2971 domain-containing protein [Pedobacter sp. Leaf216]KQM77902.1 hypothetical protein ASE74_16000 [Pedobacter sp. Leaf216]